MNEQFVFVVLVLMSVITPLVIKYFANLVDIIDKSTLKSQISYLNVSTMRSIFKNTFYKTEIDYLSFFTMFIIVFLSVVSINFVWLEYLLIYNVEERVLFLLFFLIKIFLFNFYYDQSRRINKTDLLIQLSNYFIFYLLSLSIFVLGKNISSFFHLIMGLASIVTIDIFLITRTEKLTAIKSFYVKYILELVRYGHTLAYLHILLKNTEPLEADIKILLLVFLPVLINLFISLFFNRSINSKVQGVNKKQDRLIICLFLIILLVGEFI